MLLEAEKFNHQEVFIERAKICWAREKNTEAISVLEKGLLDQFQNANDVSKLSLDEKSICSKAKLLRARYIDEAANLGKNSILHSALKLEKSAISKVQNDLWHFQKWQKIIFLHVKKVRKLHCFGSFFLCKN